MCVTWYEYHLLQNVTINGKSNESQCRDLSFMLDLLLFIRGQACRV